MDSLFGSPHSTRTKVAAAAAVGSATMKPCSLLPPASGKKRARPAPVTTSSAATAGGPSSAAAPDVADLGSLIKIDEKINNPVDFLKALFSLSDTTRKWMEQQQQQGNAYNGFRRPDEEAVEAYDLLVVRAIRERNVDKLRAMLDEGRKFDASNKFGESLIHMACRRGDLGVIEFLIEEAQVRLDIADDFGRTPLHDACWTSKPNRDVVGLLIRKVPPSMLLVEDVRGHTPFHYARREHWPTWVAFLRENAHVILQRVSILQAIQLLD